MNPHDELSNGDTNRVTKNSSLVHYRNRVPLQLPNNIEADLEEEGSLGIRDYWLMVLSRFWLILAITLLVTALALVYVARLPDVYESQAIIQIDLENNQAFGSSKNGSVVINNPDETSYFNTQLLLLKSPAFLRRVAKTLDMEKGPNAFVWDSSQGNTAGGTLLRIIGLGRDRSQSDSVGSKPLRAGSIAPMSTDGDMGEAARLEPHVAVIRRGLDVKLTETSRLITITFTHSDPNSAARAANVIADTFVQANWERRTSSTSTTSDFLQKRIAELHSKIGENERRLIEYARNHQIFPLDSGRDIQSDRLAALDRGLLEAENLRKAAEADYQSALAPGAAAALVEGGTNNGQLSTIKARLAEARQRRAVVLIEAGENWPEVKELDKQIADLEEQLKQTSEHAIGVVLTNLETRFRQALAREQSLRKAFEQQHNSAMSQNAAAIDYRMIQQETSTYKGLLDSLLQRSKENEIVLAATPNNVHVTDYATLSVMPVGPRRLVIVAVTFAISLGLAIGLAVFLGSLEDNVLVDSVERVENLFGLPALAVIPLATRRRFPVWELLKLRSHNGHGQVGLQQEEKLSQQTVGNGNGRARLLLASEGPSSLAESYKKLRTSVMHTNGNSALTTLLVTSSLPGEGKTTAVINTGLVMAQTGGKVLLIDGDLRHPSLHEVLGIRNNPGLSTILSSDLSEAEAFATIEQFNGTNLYVLPAGPATDRGAELLGSERMRILIDSLKSDFSHIIIDSPPISFFTDAVLISSLVDGVLMMVRGPKTPRQVARYSIQSLDAVGAPILGVVLNAVNIRSRDYSYYRYYYR